ncbi:MAG: hypothetical protein L6R39_001446 [Caloplaca ligustica]|nr:MAG: hypothetical protein L6R39_001446 [Caloplaca ligustica]
MKLSLKDEWAVFGREVAAVLGLTNELSNSDVTILLKYLARDKQVLAYDKDVIRLGAPGEVPAPISKQDREIASLKSLMDDLNEQIRSLETRIAALRERSQKAVELKNRASALTALRSKRAAETVLARRTDTLFQLEEIYGKIDQASDQITMLRVMKGSTEVLRNLNAKVGGTQDVEDVLDSLKDEMGQVEDVGMAISQAGQETNAAAEVEVDEELDALMRENHRIAEQEAAEETKRRLDSIQTVGKADDSTANQAKDGRQTTAMQIPGPSLTEEVRTIERMSLDQGASGTPSGISDVSWNSLSREKDANATLEMS